MSDTSEVTGRPVGRLRAVDTSGPWTMSRLEQLAEDAEGYAQQADQLAATVDEQARRSAHAWSEVIETLGALHTAFDELAAELVRQAQRPAAGECSGTGEGEERAGAPE